MTLHQHAIAGRPAAQNRWRCLFAANTMLIVDIEGYPHALYPYDYPLFDEQLNIWKMLWHTWSITHFDRFTFYRDAV